MNILHISHGFPPYEFTGVETYLYKLCKAATKEGHNVFVFCRMGRKDKPEYYVEESTKEGISIIRINNNFIYAAYNPFITEDRQVEKIFNTYIQKVRPDVVHINHLIGLSPKLPLILKRLKIPYIVTIHDFWYLCPTFFLLDDSGELCEGPKKVNNRLIPCRHSIKSVSGKTLRTLKTLFVFWNILPLQVKNILWYQNSVLKTLLQREIGDKKAQHKDIFSTRLDVNIDILKNASYIICPSNFVYKKYKNVGLPNKKLMFIPHPLDLHSLDLINKRNQKNKTVVFAYIGTLLEYKGIKLLINSFSRVADKTCQLHIYGRKGIDENLNVFVEKAARKDRRVILKGTFRNEQIKNVLEKIDVLVIPSLCQESFSYVLHEALYTGIPVIASDIGVFKDAIIEGKNGYLFKRNDAEQLTAKITLMIKHELYKKHVKNIQKEMNLDSYQTVLLRLYKYAGKKT